MEYEFIISCEDKKAYSANIIGSLGDQTVFQFEAPFQFWEEVAKSCDNPNAGIVSYDTCCGETLCAKIMEGNITLDVSYSNMDGRFGSARVVVPMETYKKMYNEPCDTAEPMAPFINKAD